MTLPIQAPPALSLSPVPTRRAHLATRLPGFSRSDGLAGADAVGEDATRHAQGISGRHQLIAAVAALVLAAAGIAGVKAWASARIDAGDGGGDVATLAPVGATCAECGVVESIREIVPIGGGGDAVVGPSARTYEVRVHMKDGSIRRVNDARPANWRAGERVIFIGGPRFGGD